MNQDTIWQLIRYALMSVGGYLTGSGLITADQWTTIVGGVMTILPIVWGVYVKWNTRAVPAATAEKPSVPTVSAATGAVQK